MYNFLLRIFAGFQKKKTDPNNQITQTIKKSNVIEHVYDSLRQKEVEL